MITQCLLNLSSLFSDTVLMPGCLAGPTPLFTTYLDTLVTSKPKVDFECSDLPVWWILTVNSQACMSFFYSLSTHTCVQWIFSLKTYFLIIALEENERDRHTSFHRTSDKLVLKIVTVNFCRHSFCWSPSDVVVRMVWSHCTRWMLHTQ